MGSQTFSVNFSRMPNCYSLVWEKEKQLQIISGVIYKLISWHFPKTAAILPNFNGAVGD